MQRKDKNYVYFIKQNEFVKIGRSNKPFKRNHVGKFELLRFYGLQHSPSDILFPI